jgi:quercetin dioxygenase-like cupin family protein
MEVTRIDDARPYDAPRHFGMSTLRLQGEEATALEAFTVGLSHALPGGGAERGAAAVERTYIVLTGELFVSTDTGSETLRPLDSCYLPAGEERLLENRTNRPTTFLVVMPKK